MAYIHIHNIVDMDIQQKVVTNGTDNSETYGIITITIINTEGVKDEIILFGADAIALPNITLKASND